MDKEIYERRFGKWLHLTPTLYAVSMEGQDQYVIQTCCVYVFEWLYDNYPDCYKADNITLILGSSYKFEDVKKEIINYRTERRFQCRK